MDTFYGWNTKYNLEKQLSDLWDKSREQFDEAKSKEDKSQIYDAYAKVHKKICESSKIHALSKKHYVFRIIIEEDLANLDRNYIPSSKNITWWSGNICYGVERLAEKFDNWLPPENQWDQHFRTNGGKVVGTKITLDCFFNRIEYLDPDILFDYIFKIYLTVCDCVDKINEAKHQRFSITVKDCKSNEWYATEIWPKDEGKWTTIWKRQPLDPAGNRARQG